MVRAGVLVGAGSGGKASEQEGSPEVLARAASRGALLGTALAASTQLKPLTSLCSRRRG